MSEQQHNKAQEQKLAQEEKGEQIIALGAKLKSIREAQGFTTAEMAAETKIQKHYIEAMEAGRLELLPKGPYVRSFLREYCTRLSAADLWRSYDLLTTDRKLVVPGLAAASSRSGEPEQNYGGSPRIFKNRSYAWIYAIVIVSICAAVWLTWQNRSNFTSVSTSPQTGGTASVEKPAPPSPAAAPAPQPSVGAAATGSADVSVDLGWMDGKAPAPKPQAPVAPAAAPSAASADTAAPGGGHLVITSRGVVWFKVTQSGKTLFEGILRSGESKDFTGGTEQLRVRYGNPGKTSASWNGQPDSQVADGSRPVTRYYKPDGTISDKR